MINITFPDKSVRKYDSSITGHDLAKSISNSLAKNAICIEIDGELRDLSYLIENDAVCKIFTKDDQYSLDTLRHSTAHVLAQAVLIFIQALSLQLDLPLMMVFTTISSLKKILKSLI